MYCKHWRLTLFIDCDISGRLRSSRVHVTELRKVTLNSIKRLQHREVRYTHDVYADTYHILFVLLLTDQYRCFEVISAIRSFEQYLT